MLCIINGLKPSQTHNIINFLEIIEKELNKINNKLPIIKYIETTKEMVKEIEKKYNTNLDWWKASLDAEKTKDEEYFCKILKRQLDETPWFIHLMRKQIQTCVGKDQQNLQKRIDIFEKCFNGIKKESKEGLGVSIISMTLFNYNLDLFDLLGKIILDNPDDNDRRMIGLLVLWSWIVNFSISFLKIHPHEVYGRYAYRIDGKSTLKWYNKNHLKLYKIEQEIKSICCKLDKTLFYNQLDNTSSYLKTC